MKFIDSKYLKSNLVDTVVRLEKKGIIASTTDDYANIPGKQHIAREIRMGIVLKSPHLIRPNTG